jgi:UDP-N-acetylmuramate--alanine ligase
LLNYSGIKRRFEILGKHNGVIIIDDYAHHPTAVRETLAACRLRYPDKKIWAIFEPHTYSRTQATLPELATSFKDADEVLLAEIYPAREQKTPATITSQEVISKIKEHHQNVRLVNTKSEAESILKTELSIGDIVVVMAVGNFNQLGHNLLNQ